MKLSKLTTKQEFNLSNGMRCAKYVLLMISFMFAITAVLLIMIGSTIEALFGDFNIFIDVRFESPPILLVAIGFILLAVAVYGCYGAIRESVLMINVYGLLLFFVFILEFSAAIAAFIMQTQVRDMLVRTMTNALTDYESNEYIQAGVDCMQTGLQCCGINSPSDWQPYWSENQNLTLDNYDNEIFVPASCCAEWSHFAAGVCDVQNEYGCLHRMDFLISQSTMLIATGAMTVAFVQLLGVFCAFMLAKTLRRNKSIREARRWQLQQTLGILASGGKEPLDTSSPHSGYTKLQRHDINIEHDPVEFKATSPIVN